MSVKKGERKDHETGGCTGGGSMRRCKKKNTLLVLKYLGRAGGR